MSEKQDQSKAVPLEIQLEDLVAYLDGELSDVDAEVIEKDLVVNSPLRKTAEEFDRTWQLLDSLEEVSASQEFTQRTLSSMIAAAPIDDAEVEAGRPERLFRFRQLIGWSVWMTTAFLFTAAGLLAGKWSGEQNQNRADAQILKNLDFLEAYYRYHLLPSSEFLRKLEFPAQPPGMSRRQD